MWAGTVWAAPGMAQPQAEHCGGSHGPDPVNWQAAPMGWIQSADRPDPAHRLYFAHPSVLR